MRGKYDYDLIVIGGGAAGLTASTGAGQLGAKTLLVEKESSLGGDCLHYGCVPSKTLIKSAYVYHTMRHAQDYGLPAIELPPVNFSEVAQRIKNIQRTIQYHDSSDFIKKKYNVDTLFGNTAFIDDHTIEVDRKKITAKFFIIATGSSPYIPPIDGLNDVDYLTNMTIFTQKKLPKSLIILGGGPIGLELGQSFSRLGSKVTIIQNENNLLSKEDDDVGKFICEKFRKEGIEVILNATATEVELSHGLIHVHAENKSRKHLLVAEAILVSTGRSANVDELGLNKLGIKYTKRGIKVDQRLRTSVKNIFACGDCIGGYQFTHVAGYEAGIAMMNTIVHLPLKVDYTRVPWVTYLDPEIASIGYNEKRAKEGNLKFDVNIVPLKDNDRALAEGEPEGFVKMLTNKKGLPIGVQIVGYHAGDLLSEWVAILNGKVKLSTVAQSIHAYPTMSEINKTTAGNYLAPQFFNNPVIKWLSSI